MSVSQTRVKMEVNASTRLPDLNATVLMDMRETCVTKVRQTDRQTDRQIDRHPVEEDVCTVQKQ